MTAACSGKILPGQSHDSRLELACKAADSYPKNLIRTQAFRHSLQSYQARLEERQRQLFDPNPDYTVIHLWEAFDRQNGWCCGLELVELSELTIGDRIFPNKLQKLRNPQISSHS